MVSNATLQSLPIMPLHKGDQMAEAARAAGLTPQQIEQVIARELKEHGSPSRTASKAMISGTLVAIVYGLIAVGGWATNRLVPAQYLFFLAVALFGWWISGFGTQLNKHAALSAAVLRAHASSMNFEQISILKDDPRLERDNDARLLLCDIQQILGQEPAL